jgi:hypothetical protein
MSDIYGIDAVVKDSQPRSGENAAPGREPTGGVLH